MRRTLEVAERCIRRDRARQHPTCRSSRRPTAATRSTTSSSCASKGSSSRYEHGDAGAARAAPVRAEDDQGDGLRRLLPDRLGLHPLREARTASASARAAARPPARSPPTRLEITDIDPIRYDLLFERFLNPGRKEMPDIDIDFAVDGRERVINYVSEKYGRDRVAQIITFGTMAARAAVRDAGRVLEIPYGVVDKIAKLIPEGPGPDARRTASSRAPSCKTAYDTDPAAKEIIDLARPLEGLDPPGLDPRRRRRHRRRAADRRRAAAAEGPRPGGRDPVLDERPSRRSAC